MSATEGAGVASKISLPSSTIVVIPPAKIGAPIEVYVAEEFIGVLHKDEDEGEVSYTLMMSILAGVLALLGLAYVRRV